MSTYDPFTPEERPKLGAFAGLPSAPPGTVLVVDREGHPLQQLREHSDRLTAGEARWGRIRTLYRVDVTEHHLEFTETFPCSDDVGGFSATVKYTCRVTDPADVVRRGIHDVARTLVPAVSETIRRECVRHPAEEFEGAERAAAAAVRGTEAEGGHDAAFTITNFHLVLTLDGTASTFVHERKEVEREHKRQQDAARLEREKAHLQAELDRAKDELEAQRSRASSEFEQERLLLQRTRERLEAQLEDQRQELGLARDAARRLTEHQTDNTLELARLEFEAVRQQKQAELDAARLALELERAELQARYDMQALQSRLALQKVEVTQLTDMLAQGEYVALAMKLTQEPAAIGAVIDHMTHQRREDTDRQLTALKLLVENDGLEGFEITEQAKAVLVRLIDTWTPRRNELGQAAEPAVIDVRATDAPVTRTAGDAAGATESRFDQPFDESGADPAAGSTGQP